MGSFSFGRKGPTRQSFKYQNAGICLLVISQEYITNETKIRYIEIHFSDVLLLLSPDTQPTSLPIIPCYAEARSNKWSIKGGLTILMDYSLAFVICVIVAFQISLLVYCEPENNEIDFNYVYG